MNENENENAERVKMIPFIAHESTVACLERTIRRLWIMCILLIVILIGTNGLWLWYESQFEYFTVTQESETGTNNYIGNDGEISYGTTDSNGKTKENWW